jgi:membrane protein implicated in regulation of membrane protease activity
MIEWWNSLEPAMKILWAVTLSASLVFVIQTVMTFLGAAGDSDFDINSDIDADAPGDIADGSVDMGGGPDVGGHDVDHPSTGMNLLTFRNFINFLIGFGWTAILLKDSVPATGLRMLIAIVVGIVLVVIVMLLFKWLTDMQQSGNINVYKSAIGCEGTVYLSIPGERAGEGKVQITINNAVREYEAVTDGPTLKTGARIRVVEVVSANTLLVEEINSVII